MVKPKQRNNRRTPGKNHPNQGLTKVDPPDEEDWVVVKKQRVTIIIPPLPNKAHTKMPSVGEGHLQEKPRTSNNSESPRKTNSQLQYPSPVSPSKQPIHEPDKSMSSPEHAIQPPIATHTSEPDSNLQKPSSLHHSHREGNGFGPCSTISNGGSKGMKIFFDGSAFLNQRMRLSYLEKKLKKAGGLENWLASLGLTRFIKIFRRRSVNKFQLANLTMTKLKDMGTDPVGPRRKLMHAIDCLCEPHCFQHV